MKQNVIPPRSQTWLGDGSGAAEEPVCALPERGRCCPRGPCRALAAPIQKISQNWNFRSRPSAPGWALPAAGAEQKVGSSTHPLPGSGPRPARPEPIVGAGGGRCLGSVPEQHPRTRLPVGVSAAGAPDPLGHVLAGGMDGCCSQSRGGQGAGITLHWAPWLPSR